jgi:hypothetical protein
MHESITVRRSLQRDFLPWQVLVHGRLVGAAPNVREALAEAKAIEELGLHLNGTFKPRSTESAADLMRRIKDGPHQAVL